MTVFKMGTSIKNFISGINANFSEIVNKLTYKPVSYKVLYEGSADIPSNSSGNSTTITLTDNITKFDGVIIQRESAGAWQRFDSLTVGKVFKVMNCESDFELVEGCNLYMCNVEIISTTKLKLNNNVYAGVKTTAAGRYMTSFTDRPLTKIIGIKLN